ncbi:MAG: protease inhibitor I42 family protein [Terracidiphilus sp.]|nr:protease inhibitor I42 family protein [Terracidiphilus sp.]
MRYGTSRFFSLRFALLVVALALTCAGAACAAVIKADGSDDGKTIHLRKGSALQISLEANASTGYGWELQPASTPLLKLQSHSYINAATNRPGAPGTALFRFSATGKGAGTLSMQYVRPWEHVSASRVFLLHIVIQ